MNNREISEMLLHISRILNIQGENSFKVRAYVKASETIVGLTRELSSLEDSSQVLELPGIGAGIGKKLQELLETGKLEYYEELKRTDYASLTTFLEIPGMGPKHSRLVYEKLGVKDVAGLKKAAQEGQLRKLPGLGEKAEQKILRGIGQVQKYKERFPVAFVYPRAREILEQISKLPEVERALLAGSLRRMRDTVADVDILVTSPRPAQVMEAFVNLPQIAKVVAKGKTKSSVVTGEGIPIDLRVVANENFGAASHYFTGSRAHNIRIRSLAGDRQLKVNEYGVFAGEDRVTGNTEEDIFRAVGLCYIPPELREDRGEIEAAQSGRLPSLVEPGDIRGDLHVHTDWSDGKNTVEEMARAARKRGYRYLAICDHSPAMAIAHGLGAERLLQQIAEIEKWNAKLRNFRILSGVEVDIRADGELDLEDDILKELDVVVAAVHSRLGQSEKEMTRRITMALENPHVDILAHPTGRLLGKREPCALDMDRVMDACKANGKALELNAQPDRLDLSDVNCRKAREKGVKIAISTDSHVVAHLEWIKFGIATARRGWLETQDVINTLTLRQLRKFLAH